MIHLSGIFVVRKGQYSQIYVLEVIFAVSSYCQNLSCNKGQSSVIIRASKMIHLSGIFVVRKGQYSQIYVLGSYFAANSKNAYKNGNNCQKLSIIMM
jgi:hypothetical protein